MAFFCTQCGEPLKEGIRFCTACGAPVPTGAKTVPGEHVHEPEAAETVVGDSEASNPEIAEPKVIESGEVSELEKEPEAFGACEEEAIRESNAEEADTTLAAATGAAETAALEAGPAGSDTNGGSFVADGVGASFGGGTCEAGLKASSGFSDSHPRRKRAAVILSALALVVVASAGVILWARGGFDPTALISGASSGTMTLSRTTRLVPRASDGTTPEHYYVRIKRAVGLDGQDLDTSSTGELEVSDGQGFVPGDLIGDLPNGVYTFEVDDGEHVFELPPTEIDDSEEDAPEGQDGEVIIEYPSEEGTESGKKDPKSADELFLDKIVELEGMYGEATLETTKLTGTYDGMTYGGVDAAYVSGLAYAQLLDFGDGSERLVVTYLDKSSKSEAEYGDYHLEVWEYDEASSALVCALKSSESTDPKTYPYSMFSLLKAEGGSYVVVMPGGSGSFDWQDYIERFIGLKEDGTVGVTDDFSTLIQDQENGDVYERLYLLNGTEVTAEEQSAARINLVEEGSWSDVFLCDVYPTEEAAASGGQPDSDGTLVGTYFFPADTIELTMETKAILQSRIDGTAAHDDSNERIDVTAHEAMESVELPTFASGGKSSDGSETYEWGYLELSGEGLTPTLTSALNKVLKNDFERAKSEALAWTPGGSDEGQCVSYRSRLTCARDGLLGMRVQQYRTAWGVHGGTKVIGYVQDATTGGIRNPWDAFGMSMDEAEDAAVEAITQYVVKNPSDLGTRPESEIRTDAREFVEDDATFLLTDEGMTVFLPEYVMGYSYASGCKEVVVQAFDDPSLVGTDVWAKYRIDY